MARVLIKTALSVDTLQQGQGNQPHLEPGVVFGPVWEPVWLSAEEQACKDLVSASSAVLAPSVDAAASKVLLLRELKKAK